MDLEVALLKRLHPIAFDKTVAFEPCNHKYTYLGNPVPTTVTGLTASCFEKFNGSEIISRCFSKWESEPSSEYFDLIEKAKKEFPLNARNVAREWILKSWETKGELARKKGTDVHAMIDRHANGRFSLEEQEKAPPEFQAYLNFRKENLHLQPFRTEVSLVLANERGQGYLAGQADMICIDKTNDEFVLLDWKASKKDLGPAAKAYRKGLNEASEMWEREHTKYAIQLALYSRMFKEAGMSIKKRFIVQLQESSFIVHEIDKELVLTTDEVVEKLLLTIRNTQPKHARNERETMQDGKKKKTWGGRGSN